MSDHEVTGDAGCSSAVPIRADLVDADIRYGIAPHCALKRIYSDGTSDLVWFESRTKRRSPENPSVYGVISGARQHLPEWAGSPSRWIVRARKRMLVLRKI